MSTNAVFLKSGAQRTPSRPLVVVQGLGFVGAANAIAIASATDHRGAPKFDVVGVDLPNEQGEARANSLSTGIFPFPTSDKDLERAAAQCKARGNLVACTDASPMAEASVVVIDVGLDLEEKGNAPKLKLPPFQTAIETAARTFNPNALVLLESTVPPGTCEQIAAPILRAGMERRGADPDSLKLAYCYERVMPGDKYLDSIRNMWRVFAGLTPAAADEAEAFLSSFTNTAKPLTRLASLRAAEMAKVLENTYRAVTIALIDEWEQFARAIDVDLFEVLEAIRVRPTHNNIRYPGLGVGGYCLSKDPMFGRAAADAIYHLPDQQFPLSLAAVKINDEMPLRTVSALRDTLGTLVGKHTVVLGACYREGVGDTRLSPSATLANALVNEGAHVTVVDPLVKEFPEAPTVKLMADPPSASGVDALVLAVAHAPFRVFDIPAWAGSHRPVVFDANGVLSWSTMQHLQESGFLIGGIGRGKSRQ